MKKLSLFFVLVVAMFAMVSCGSGNTPTAVTKAALEAAQSKNFDKVVDLMGDKNGNALNEEASKQLKSMFQEKVSKDNVKTINSFKIENEEITDDGKKAVVTYSVTYDGDDTKQETMELNKGEDGVWRLSLGK